MTPAGLALADVRLGAELSALTVRWRMGDVRAYPPAVHLGVLLAIVCYSVVYPLTSHKTIPMDVAPQSKTLGEKTFAEHSSDYQFRSDSFVAVRHRATRDFFEFGSHPV